MLAAIASEARLDAWLLRRGCSFSDRTQLARTDGTWTLTALSPLPPRHALLQLHEAALLSASAAFADRELGEALRAMAARLGPGSDTLALAALLAADRLRSFRAAAWFAGSRAAAAAGAPHAPLSPHAPLTRALWARAARRAPAVPPELAPLVGKGVALLHAELSLAARRAWAPGEANGGAAAAELFDDGWEEERLAAGRSWGRAEVEEVLWDAFALVLDAQVVVPPRLFARGEARLTDERSPRWGWWEGAHTGAVLLPPIDGVFVGDAGEPNAEIGAPPRPLAGNLGEGIVCRCVALKEMDAGTRVQVIG
ncbi:hypothetical protein AB1Y20_010756 [Prymnesium parvum]|uniref:Uncharacterized protein n=1 Tax=Prymnesium parvum TaxID=97485 RepID=A0AB34IQF2_PRYPA